MARKDLRDSLQKLAAAEREFLDSEFVAPVMRGGGVRVRIAGVVCEMTIVPADFEGFGVFRPKTHSNAALVRDASMSERRRYLELFPRVLMVICKQERARKFAVPANSSDARFQIDGLVEIRLPDEANLFDTIAARFDGSQFWFDEIDTRTDPAAAGYLRQELPKMTEPQKLERAALSPGQRLAYLVNFRARLAAMVEDERTRTENRLREALEHAGAQLRDFNEHRDEYRVSYDVDGRRHTSVVRKNDLTVQSAGICLAGQDRNFDLHSLVSVLREARNV